MSDPGWYVDLTDEGEGHVRPARDLIEHELDPDCVCGPVVWSVRRDDGSLGWIHSHPPLDGRRWVRPVADD